MLNTHFCLQKIKIEYLITQVRFKRLLDQEYSCLNVESQENSAESISHCHLYLLNYMAQQQQHIKTFITKIDKNINYLLMVINNNRILILKQLQKCSLHFFTDN